jgi:pimeloyl-ACP methyl ester carboxylesterase
METTAPFRQTVISADGTKIFAEAAGDRKRPAVIFVHGLASCSAVFNRQLNDPQLLSNLYLVNDLHLLDPGAANRRFTDLL